ncbi:MAG: hypothetical protein KF791_07390 [Verrucomicrobiae bacterium]|nr:hypothetical protein [Verrucomicrobiae bacterium]
MVAALALAGCALVDPPAKSEKSESEVPILLEDCPGPVQAALLAEAYKAGGVIGEIERETESDGSVVYEGTVMLPGGGEVEVEVAPDGRVLEVESP